MHRTDLSGLQGNLSEIYPALHAGGPIRDSFNLYATSLTSVYHLGSWIGQGVKYLDRMWRWISSTALIPVNLALEFILNTLFNQAVQEAYTARQYRIFYNIQQLNHQIGIVSETEEERLDRYADFLKKELRGSSKEEELEEEFVNLYLNQFGNQKELTLTAEIALRHLTIDFQQATYPLWRLLTKKEMTPQCRSLIDFANVGSSAALIDRVLFKALKKEKQWVCFEGILQRSVPMKLLAKWQAPKSLTVDECDDLKAWIQAINDNQRHLSPRLLATVLMEIVQVIYLHGFSTPTLSDLLYWLDQEGCQLIDQEDPYHLDWREQLHPGDSIKCNGKKLILGEQLSPHRAIDDVYKIFALKEYPSYVVKIANNRFRLLIEAKKLQNEEDHWGVRFVDTIDHLEENREHLPVAGLDREGRCVIMERLTSPFDCYVWKSQEWKLTDEDEKRALVFANHLFCMREWNASSQNLSLAHLMWDRQGVLKSTRLLKKGPPNYNEWEGYCERAVKGNGYVLRFLMKVSKLSEHKMANHYFRAVEHTLKTGETNLLGHPLPLGHRQEVYDRHVEDLCHQAKKIRKSCCKHVVADLREKGQYSHKNYRNVQKEVVNALIHYYQSSPTPGRLSADLESCVIRSILNRSQEESLPEDLEAYYQEQHERMMTYNRSMLRKQHSFNVKT